MQIEVQPKISAPRPAVDDCFTVLSVTMKPARIGFLRFILEGYDGMAIVTTIDAKRGKVIIRHPVSFADELRLILADL